MKCIRCKDLDLKEMAVGGINIDTCDSCGGVWFDADELKIIVEQGLTEDAIEEFNFTPSKKVEYDELILKCPNCNGLLKEINYMYDSSVKVDCCRTCNGIWLDGGELLDIKDYMKKVENFDESKINDALMRAKVAGAKTDEIFQKSEKAHFGKDTFLMRALFKFFNKIF